MPGQGLPIDPYSGLAPVGLADVICTFGPLRAWSGAVAATRPAGPDGVVGAACASAAARSVTLAPFAADSIRARVQ